MAKSRKPNCPNCNNQGQYNETFDAYYCKPCSKWLETPCTDPDCNYCTKRPEKPAIE